LLGALLYETRFLNNFDGKYLIGVLRDELVASCEAPLTQKVAFYILGNGVVFEAVILDDV
jgi:hypothetical protein